MTSKIVVNNIEADAGISTVNVLSDVSLSSEVTGNNLIVNTNKVGIGTTNPTELVTVGSAVTTALFEVKPHVSGFDINVSSGDFAPHYQDNFVIYKGQPGSGTERFRISTEGYLTASNQPTFFSRPAGGYNLSSGSNSPIGGTWSDVHNIGSHFSNGTFTVPVAGTYQFSWSVFNQSETDRIDAYILVNGASVMREEINGYPSTAANKSSSVHGCYYLSANDNVTFGVYSAAGTQIYSSASPWTYACGFLIG